MARSIFDFESEDRVESPERLNEYIRVASPGTWALVGAMVIVMVAFLVWGFTGTIPETDTFRGVVDKTMGYDVDVIVDSSEYTGKSLIGREAHFTLSDGVTRRGTIVNSTDTPLSRKEMEQVLESDYLSKVLISADYSYILDLKPEDDLENFEYELTNVTIITREIKPINFLSR